MEIVERFLFLRLSRPGGSMVWLLGFVSAGSVSSSSTPQIFRDTKHVWLLCPPLCPSSQSLPLTPACPGHYIRRTVRSWIFNIVAFLWQCTTGNYSRVWPSSLCACSRWKAGYQSQFRSFRWLTDRLCHRPAACPWSGKRAATRAQGEACARPPCSLIARLPSAAGAHGWRSDPGVFARSALPQKCDNVKNSLSNSPADRTELFAAGCTDVLQMSYGWLLLRDLHSAPCHNH